MSFANNPLIRRTLAPQPSPDSHAEARERLWNALRQFRQRAATLANEIHRDLPDFTVHDITHLDALWEMADLIAGPDYPLNPLEAFALGAVFLLHDLGLGLAAWPGGLDELKKESGWQDALSTDLRKHLKRIPTAEELASPPPEVERRAVQELLRALHAKQAERLALASWRHKGGPEYHLIEDPDLRENIGHLLGKIAHSHWWPVSRLGTEFGTVRGGLPNIPNFPGDWTLDPLKIAVLLRTADAAHLDARRAPGYLIALRRPEGISEEHWRFQNHLLKPCIPDDRLIYTTNRPFLPEEVNAWWLCEETLRMVDREIQQVDTLLYDLSRPRFRAKGVAGTESPLRLQKYIEVSGWTPVDARLHVSNVADLARKMGGEQLYGDDPTVPLRELIQNASDAVRARRLLENRPSDWGRITVRLGRDGKGSWAEVEDTGIGMSEAVLTGSLLDFGTTYWGSGLMREEHEGLWAKGFEPTGRFGIGFFSVFMWGRRVQVSTRRYKVDSQENTRVLEFRTGLETRPLVRPATSGEQLRDGGTRVRVWLNKEPRDRGGLLHSGDGYKPANLGALCAWLAPALDVDLYVEDENGASCVVAASDWLRITGIELLARISPPGLTAEERDFASLLRVVKDSEGHALGRAAIFDTDRHGSRAGVNTVGGLRVGRLEGVLGILTASMVTAVRDKAVLLAGPESLAKWASEQATLIVDSIPDPYYQMACVEYVVERGGNPGRLPVAKRGESFVDLKTLAGWENAPDTIVLLSSDALMLSVRKVNLHCNVLVTLTEKNRLYRSASGRRDLRELVIEAIVEAWGSSGSVVCLPVYEEYEVGSFDNGIPVILNEVTIVKKPNSPTELGI
jgi:hypothetical protein